MEIVRIETPTCGNTHARPIILHVQGGRRAFGRQRRGGGGGAGGEKEQEVGEEVWGPQHMDRAVPVCGDPCDRFMHTLDLAALCVHRVCVRATYATYQGKGVEEIKHLAKSSSRVYLFMPFTPMRRSLAYQCVCCNYMSVCKTGIGLFLGGQTAYCKRSCVARREEELGI